MPPNPLANPQRLSFWSRLVKALETTIPYYERVNLKISLGQIQKLRERAVEKLKAPLEGGGAVLLDAGIGPGNMTLTAQKALHPSLIIGLDASPLMLHAAKTNLESEGLGNVLLVRGVFEALPLTPNRMEGAICSFSLRDAIDIPSALAEIHTALRGGGRLLILEVGRPPLQILDALYFYFWRILVPLIARGIFRRRLKDNPWVWLAWTYEKLPPNEGLKTLLSQRFSHLLWEEPHLGGIIIAVAEK